MATTTGIRKNWTQHGETLFDDLQSTGTSLEIQKGYKDLLSSLQTVRTPTLGNESGPALETAAKQLAVEVHNLLKDWETFQFGNQPKLADNLPKSGGSATAAPAEVTVDDTAWTSGDPKGGGPRKDTGGGRSAIDSKQIERTQKALAKGLPALASGIRDAIRGFEKGDKFAGSAAIMDICATLASTVGSVTAAGGPPGALIGALFSIVSMVLKAFIPPQKSLLQEIDGIVREIVAETKQQGLASARGAIESLISTLVAPGTRWQFSYIQDMFNPIDGTAVNTIRDTASWLETTTNQDLKLWGPVLAQQCQTYIMMMQILAIASANVDVSDELDQGASTYANLAALFTANDAGQLSFLRNIRSAAQARGTVWHIGVFDATGEYPDSGNLFFTDSLTGATRDDWENLEGEQRAFAVSRTRMHDAENPDPYLAVFALEKADTQRSVPGAAYRHRKNARTYGLFGKWPLTTHTGWRKIANLEGLTDICATPGEADRTVYVYTASGGQHIKGYVHGERPIGEGDIELKESKTFSVNPNHTVDSVAAAIEPETVDGDEPEVLHGETSVVYGAGFNALRARYIHAFFSSGIAGEIKTPSGLDSSITGLRVDNKRLWVFTRAKIFCTTHSSVKDYLRRARRTAPAQLGTLAGPQWGAYQVPSQLGGAWQTEGRYDGLHEIGPCDDGTLWAVFTDKRGNKNMYYSTPNFANPAVIAISGFRKDAGGHDIATNGWTKIPSQGNRIQKQPIFCWSVVEQLTQRLEKAQPHVLEAAA